MLYLWVPLSYHSIYPTLNLVFLSFVACCYLCVNESFIFCKEFASYYKSFSGCFLQLIREASVKYGK